MTFDSNLSITYIGTATTIIEIDGARFLTDPAFDNATTYDMGIAVLEKTLDPGLKIEQLPPIDAILLSHEDHPDNLDATGRTLLPGRRILTTMDGAKNLSLYPGVSGLKPWETIAIELGGKNFTITATPCEHMLGGEVIGFLLHTNSLGTGVNGLPNVIYFGGDTIYIKELEQIGEKYNVKSFICNLGVAYGPPDGKIHKEPYKITMSGKDAANLSKKIGADVIIPVHFEEWTHFQQGREASFTKRFRRGRLFRESSVVRKR